MSNREKKPKIWGIPERGTTRRLLEITLAWAITSLASLLIAPGTTLADSLPLLLLLFIAVPVVRLVLSPGTLPESPEEAYELESGLIISYVSTLGITLLLMSVLQRPEGVNPASIGTLLLGIPLVFSLTLQQRLLDLRLKSGGVVWPVLVGALILLPVITMFRADLATEILLPLLFTLLAPLFFFRSIRNQWVVRLKREAKYRLLGLSFLGVLSSIGWLVILGEMIFSSRAPMYSVAEHLLIDFAGLGAVVILSAQSGLFFRSLATLPTARAMDRRQQEVASLSNLGMMMTDSFDRDRMLQSSLETAADVTDSQLAWIRLYSEESGSDGESPLEYASDPQLATLYDALESLQVKLEDGTRAIRQIARSIEKVSLYRISGVVQGTDGSAPGLTVAGMVAIIPLMRNTVRLGALYLFTSDRKGYDGDDQLMLEAVAAQISLTLDHADLLERSLERERLLGEMEIARSAQQRLLPRSLPMIPGCSVYAASQPASLVGGDYYDSVSFSDGTIGFIVADVAGKGAGAALYMGMVKGVVRGLNGRTPDGSQFLREVNRALHRHIDPRFFVTMSVVRILGEQEEIEIARAGHTPTLLLSGDDEGTVSADLLSSPGLGLALTGDELFGATITPFYRPMLPGDTVVLFSDGLTEARDEEGEELGTESFAELVRESVESNPDCEPSEMVEGIIERISSFSGGAPQHDDITLLLIRWGDFTDRSSMQERIEETAQ